MNSRAPNPWESLINSAQLGIKNLQEETEYLRKELRGLKNALPESGIDFRINLIDYNTKTISQYENEINTYRTKSEMWIKDKAKQEIGWNEISND